MNQSGKPNQLKLYPHAHRGVRGLWIVVLVVTVAGLFAIIWSISRIGTSAPSDSEVPPEVINPILQGGSRASAPAAEESPTLNPFSDEDGDGLLNMQESQYGTDPLQKDTDGDSFDDGQEIRTNHNPLGK